MYEIWEYDDNGDTTVHTRASTMHASILYEKLKKSGNKVEVFKHRPGAFIPRPAWDLYLSTENEYAKTECRV